MFMMILESYISCDYIKKASKVISQVGNYKSDCKKPNDLEAWCYNLCAKMCETLNNNSATNNVG